MKNKQLKVNKKNKKVKAWIVTDGKDQPLVFGAMKEKPEKTIYFIYQNEAEARRHWDGFRIYPATITYSTPKPKKAKK